ncbi:MAG: Hint domain-containing protein [Paracoccaceae bacterium]|jgi:hypothetical protein
MATYVFGGWQLSDLTLTGPDPFASNALADSDAVGVSTFTIAPSASFIMLDVTDDEANFHDADSGQDLLLGESFNGQTWPAGTSIETEYSYIVRPAGSTDPADNITIYALEFNGDVVGIAATGQLLKGQVYEIVAIDSQDPTVAYSALAVCFAEGTLIATKQGPVPVQALREGMRVQTADNGYQPVLWTGQWRVNGRGRNAPVRIAAGALGNERMLEVSAQHRLAITPRDGPLSREELLLPAKALLGMPGIALAPRPKVQWHHILCETHEIVFAEGARAETFLAGPQALRQVNPATATDLEQRLNGLRPPVPARPILPPGKLRRMAQHRSAARLLGFAE